MNFFQQQAKARSLTNRLLVLFALAVIVIVVAMMFLVFLLLGQPQDTGGSSLALFSPQNVADQSMLLISTGLGTAGVLGFSSLFRIAALRGGGGKVAQELGGQRVDPDTRDPLQRRLVNVVEEIALASGVPVPEIYVLDHESGINAFAAGYSASDAIVAVTRGTLETLNRAELQGVIAHEFSHILNGDMRLNIKLMGILFGILVIAIMGRKLLRNAYLFGGRGRREGNAGAILAIAIGLVAIGYIGLFFGRWIKAAVSRQREYLADASALQFTRDPGGISGALKKIAASQHGALLEAESEEVSHMLFGPGQAAKMFATHPPLFDRIKAIEPSFQPEEIKTIAKNMARDKQRSLDDAKREAESRKTTKKAPGGFDLSADSIIENIGSPQVQAILAAAVLAESLPDPLVRAARHHEWSPALVLMLLLDRDPALKAQQLQSIAKRLGDTASQQVTELVRQFEFIEDEQRLPLLEIALPAVKRRSRKEIRALHSTVDELSMADQHISPFEFLLNQIIASYLEDAIQPGSVQEHGRFNLSQRLEASKVTLAALAWFGHEENIAAATTAYTAGMQIIDANHDISNTTPTWPHDKTWSGDLKEALEALNQLTPNAKQDLIKAWLTTVLHDQQATTHELEILRAYCATIHVPMPPLATASEKS